MQMNFNRRSTGQKGLCSTIFPAKLLSAALLAGCYTFSPLALSDTLEDVVNKALAEHPQALASLNRYRAEMESVDVAWGGYLPSLDFTTGIGGQKKDYPDEPRNDLDEKTFTRKEAALSLKQNVFSGFNTSSSVAQARHKASAEYLRMRNTLQDLALKVIDAYLKVLERRDQVELAEENLKVHDDIYKQIAQRAKQGVARNSDLAQIEGRRARANANVISARNNLMDAESEFFSLTGSMPGELEQPGSYRIELPENFPSALQKAVDHHPGVLATDFDIKSAESQAESAKSSYYPTLDIEVDRNWRNNADGLLGTHQDTTAMLRLRYNLFRGGSDQARVQESAYRTEESRAQRDRMLRNVEESLRVAWAAFEFTGEQKQYLRLHEESSKQTVEAYREQFNIGKRTLLDLLDSENELFQASRSLTSAVYQEAFARYRILGATGELLEKVNLTLPENWQPVHD